MSTKLSTGTHEISILLSGSEIHEQVIELAEQATTANVLVKIAAKGTDAPQLTLRILHAVPNTHATVLIKTLAQGKSAPTVTATLEIAENAANCTSYLTHNNLVFDSAHAWTQPALEIKNNEVACSHSATVHTITPEDLFYLQTRGIPTEIARAALIEAFLA